jgi:hypothetical protein
VVFVEAICCFLQFLSDGALNQFKELVVKVEKRRERERENGVERIGSMYCGGHEAYLPLSCFYTGSISAGETRCKACNGKARQKRRRQDPLQWLRWKMYQSEHRKGGSYPSVHLVHEIVERFCGVSAIDGSREESMCIVRYFVDLPLHEHPWNGVLVTSQQARQLARSDEKRGAVFPEHFQAEMKARK